MPVSMTFFGTTTWLLYDGETQLLLDAHLTRPSLLRAVFGKLKTNTAFVDEVLRRFPLERLQAIFVSHSHYDHVLDAAYIAQKTGADLYGTVSTKNVGLGGGLPEARLHLFEPEKPVSVGAFEITALPSIHSKPTVLNNDLGVVIERPLSQPARMRDYSEGGSYDFYMRHGEKTLLVRPSCNYIEGSLKDVRADTLLLGIGNLAKEDEPFHEAFYRETVGYVRPKRVIPVHWDNFFRPLKAPLPYQTRLADNTAENMAWLKARLEADGIAFDVVDAFETVAL